MVYQWGLTLLANLNSSFFGFEPHGVLLVVEVKAFQWNVRPRWGRNFWKSVRCCVQLVFIMFVFSPIDGLSWVFHGYHADGCSYSLVFWEFCTSLVARPVVQDSYKHRRILGRCYNKCLWGKARMGSAYHFNLLMYFLALRIGTRRLPVISFWVYPLYSQRWKPWQLYACLPSLRPFALLALACSCCLAWFPLLLHRWKLLSLTVLKRMRKRVATKEFVRRLRGSVSQNLISDLVWTSFAPRSDLVKIAASQNPARRGFGKALQWSAAWSSAWSAAAAVVVACVAASGQGAVFGQRSKRFCLA